MDVVPLPKTQKKRVALFGLIGFNPSLGCQSMDIGWRLGSVIPIGRWFQNDSNTLWWTYKKHQKAIENGHRNRWIFQLKMSGSFHCYVNVHQRVQGFQLEEENHPAILTCQLRGTWWIDGLTHDPPRNPHDDSEWSSVLHQWRDPWSHDIWKKCWDMYRYMYLDDGISW